MNGNPEQPLQGNEGLPDLSPLTEALSRGRKRSGKFARAAPTIPHIRPAPGGPEQSRALAAPEARTLDGEDRRETLMEGE